MRLQGKEIASLLLIKKQIMKKPMTRWTTVFFYKIAIENVSCFIEVACAPLTNNIEIKTRNASHLLDIIDELNSEMILDNTISLSFDIVNMYLSIDNERGITAVRNALETRVNKTPSTDCIIKGLEI